MGCDIHIEVEALWEGRWVNVNIVALPPNYYRMHPNYMERERSDPRPMDRWYSLFARLAGVRGWDDRGAIAAGRGLPPDWDQIGAAHAWAVFWDDEKADPKYEPGDHSFTWATVEELQAADWTHHDEGQVVDLSHGSFVRWLRGPRLARVVEAAGGPMRVRLVIGFDS